MATIREYIDEVRKERPILDNLVTKYGNESMWSVSERVLDRGKQQAHFYRPEFIPLFKRAFPYLPVDVLEQYEETLKSNPLISTADHHGPIDHPAFVSSNILLSLYGNITIPPILSFSSIPLNNASYPRGLLLGGPEGMKRFSFFGSRVRHETVNTVDALEFNSGTISNWTLENKKNFDSSELEFIESILKDFTRSSSVNDCNSYSEQVRIWNLWFWKKFFPNKHIYFNPIDDLTSTFFKEVLCKNSALPIYKVLFTLPQDKQERIFNGVYGAWKSDKLKSYSPGGGTWYFWGINKAKRMIPLRREGGKLTAHDKSFTSINWTPESLSEALFNKKIVPALITNYLVVGGHYGLYCSGGNNQVYYYGEIMKGYVKALENIGEFEEAKRVKKIDTSGVHQLLWLLFGKNKNKIIPLCSMNMFYIEKKLHNIMKIIDSIDFEIGFNIAAALLFPYIVSPQRRKEMNYTFEDTFIQLKNIMPNDLIFQEW
ncbi:hypothetical protein A3H80_00345 [Candidatus Roizmanbacteria bacterium RIFCSPLOWO2_02_FULL_37_19]|uniref:Uncharacterized protein n=1 Tax=Candidatus Roizmanbacteria bacterium RIFCSPHIGHO2_02_FULL_37_24 TaxID=1802037 RepID=A0A1F7H139_9BACT|nr:MAG: hypothetical protein A2862_04825 [Candidatus Roizmanbacteria bacterium RIFCSPHIGHO2_01_FULL_38_41]OGK24442.1 MAG: hypothetical protein A3C24_02055 [Candidatus Roizmanbacteria bacterium RIFCSPHIGHO2_02_FULL_37_24]OGK32656.1 MAG: hypothetical protein A3E10_01525 [Candidatus Roizmanbacteria bacterium RIFCSPHIGHO2_12_FULL_37_23]OGK44778.1 MAG: hypothetical protein A2956_01625 [Candidatus Roizmanbacteria bacterium RIFCSPLOWO2_01_FULL_37_57]OGK53970.1 MAG: hypothetical protein A3H80_00345 [Ca